MPVIQGVLACPQAAWLDHLSDAAGIVATNAMQAGSAVAIWTLERMRCRDREVQELFER
jgi:hypothetical protein